MTLTLGCRKSSCIHFLDYTPTVESELKYTDCAPDDMTSHAKNEQKIVHLKCKPCAQGCTL